MNAFRCAVAALMLAALAVAPHRASSAQSSGEACKPDFYRDVRQMLATAAEKGGAALMAKGAQPMVQLSVGPNSSGRKGIWYVNYSVKGRSTLQVMFDGATGKFEQAIPN